tara:strand:+ start:13 stop:771 length:759 start_codon:yes stop_codon:yes gene_type:complete
MNTTYHPDGNRDFRRYMESTIPGFGIVGSTVGYGLQMGKLGGQNKTLATALMNEAMRKDPRLKISNFSLNPLYKSLTGKNMPFDYDPFLASYNPKTHTVNAPRKNYGILAHELGHAEQYKNPLYRKTVAPLSKFGRIAGQFGALAPVFTDNEEEARRNAKIAGVMQIPTLVEEFDASRRGSRILSDQMAKNKLKPAIAGKNAIRTAKKVSPLVGAMSKLRPFVGMPTYLLTAAAPYLIYKYMKSRGLYEGEY